MAFDSTVMTAVTAELHQRLMGGRISKIYQPHQDEVALLIYAGGENHRLLISANARSARLHLTRREKKNPPAPPTFCMLLRKYIEGGRILAVTQPDRERICHIQVGTIDELGNPANFTLVVEVMSKHSNIVLVNPQGLVVDAIRRVTEEVNRYRELLPGLRYLPPPPTGKQDPTSISGADLLSSLQDPEQAALPLWRFLLDQIDGFSPLLTREAAYLAGFDPNTPASSADPVALALAVRRLASQSHYEPCLLLDPGGKLKDFHVLPLTHWHGSTQCDFPSVSALLETYFGRQEEENRFASLQGSLARIVRDEIRRVRRKLKAQTRSLETAENAEDFRIKGELITAHLWQIQKGQTEARVTNYYDPKGSQMVIVLDPRLDPAANAQDYYRRYQKARRGRETIQEQLSRSQGELAYLEQVETTLQTAHSLPELEEIRRELESEGYIGRSQRRARRSGTPPKPRSQRPLPPLSVRSSDGLEIWIGRNNRQNDYLTLKLAAPHDLWMHTKEIPGSHVILRVQPGQEVPERSLHEAAALAAWFSKARDSASVPVDYTLRKHVRKPSGARPGMVIYDHQKTLWVTPDPELNPILKQHVEDKTAGGDTHG